MMFSFGGQIPAGVVLFIIWLCFSFGLLFSWIFVYLLLLSNQEFIVNSPVGHSKLFSTTKKKNQV